VGIINDGTYFIGLLCRCDAISYIKQLAKGLEHSKHSVLKYKVPYYLIGVTIPILYAIVIKNLTGSLRKWPNGQIVKVWVGQGTSNILNLGIGGKPKDPICMTDLIGLWGEVAKRTLRIDDWSPNSRLYFPELRRTLNKFSPLGRSPRSPR